MYHPQDVRQVVFKIVIKHYLITKNNERYLQSYVNHPHNINLAQRIARMSFMKNYRRKRKTI